jgi:hypothetical protein
MTPNFRARLAFNRMTPEEQLKYVVKHVTLVDVLVLFLRLGRIALEVAVFIAFVWWCFQ